jgi:DNA repair photolyase
MNEKNKNPLQNIRGRGTATNTVSRFDRAQVETDLSDFGFIDEDDHRGVKTEFFRDATRTILSSNNSPDICFTYSINAYRGCEHGCAYCYARPTHEYLGMSAGLDFETKIFYKENAAALLREKLMSPKWEPQTIAISGVTDCYQPIEGKLQLTRQCLQVLAEFRNPVSLITKNELITRDVDIFKDLASDQLVSACLSVTTLNADLGRKLEPRTSSPQARLRAIETLAKAGIPVSVNIAPVIPGLTDHEIPAILKAARNAGANSAGFVPLRLPHSVKDIFSDWLQTHFPDRKEKVLSAIRDIRDGDLNSAEFGDRMRGRGPRAENIAHVFDVFSRKLGFEERGYELATDKFRRPGDQMKLF